MAHDEFRLLAAAVTLERFTATELAAAAQTNLHTTRSWLARRDHQFDRSRGKVAGRGRPQNILVLTANAATEMRRQLNETYQHAMKAVSSTDQQKLLDGVMRQYDFWKSLKDTASNEAQSQLTALRVAIRLAWRELAQIDRYGAVPERGHLKHLAQIESQIGVVAPPENASLPELALWLGRRLIRLSQQEVGDDFSRRVMWMRIEARSEADSRKITVAALAAPVWADEDLASEGVSDAVWLRCRAVAELVPISTRLARVSAAIRDDGVSLCYDDGQAQAVLRGVTSCVDARSNAIRDWLLAARMRGEWRRALAPIVVHGLLNEDDVILTEVVRTLREALQSAIHDYTGTKGRLRSEAFDYGMRVLKHTGVTSGTDDAQVASLLAARFGSKALQDPDETEVAS